jgi:serine/threonine-protein kinase SRPK3
MNGTGAQIKQAAINKAKQVAGASNGNSNKKRKKELKPIITTEGQGASHSHPGHDAEMASSNQANAG